MERFNQDEQREIVFNKQDYPNLHLQLKKQRAWDKGNLGGVEDV